MTPRFTHIHHRASHLEWWMARCDLCGWIGGGWNNEAAAKRACRDHARGKRHREDASAITRAEFAAARDTPDA